MSFLKCCIVFSFLVLGFKLRALYVLTKCLAAKLHPCPWHPYLLFILFSSENLRTFGFLIKPCFEMIHKPEQQLTVAAVPTTRLDCLSGSSPVCIFYPRLLSLKKKKKSLRCFCHCHLDICLVTHE